MAEKAKLVVIYYHAWYCDTGATDPYSVTQYTGSLLLWEFSADRSFLCVVCYVLIWKELSMCVLTLKVLNF